MSKLSYQEELVVNRLEKTLDGVNEANDVLEKRATKMVAISTAAIAVVSSAGVLPKTITGASTLDGVAVVVLVGLNLLMVKIGLGVWGPSSRATPGGTKFDDLQNHFIKADQQVACANHVKDLLNTIRLAEGWNASKGSAVLCMLWVVQCQLVVLGIAVVARVFCR